MSGSVLFAMIARLRDGLPLSATTDHEPNRRVLESKKFAKILSKKAYQFPDRCSMFTGSHWLYIISSLGVCFITMCEENYPSVLAFCFLDELQREFISIYDNKKVANVVRPYALIDFDRIIQKTKQRYNNKMTLSARMKYSDMSLEVKLRPPHRISITDLETSSRTDTTNTSSIHRTWDHSINLPVDTHKPTNFRRPFSRRDWMAKLLLVLTVMCGTLNLARIMGVLTFGTISYASDPEGTQILLKAMLTFLLATILCFYQAFLLWTVDIKRPSKQFVVGGLIILCNLYLFNLSWRYFFTVVFHVSVAVLAAVKSHYGSIELKLPDYTV